MGLILDCGHPAPKGMQVGDATACSECFPSKRSNESGTVSWSVQPMRRVIARVGVCECGHDLREHVWGYDCMATDACVCQRYRKPVR